MKKLLAISAIAALGFSGLANAGGLPEEMPMAPMAYSSDQGVYIGLSGGWGLTNWKNFDEEKEGLQRATKVDKDNGFVGRVFAGYDICKYFAIEMGYTYFFNKPEIKNPSANDMLFGEVERTHVVDLMGKIKAPVTDEFNLYAKLGANYLMSKIKDKTASPEETRNVDNFNVAFGAGADYFITPNLIANAEWLRYNGKPSITDKKYQPYTDSFMIGLRYKFDM